MQKKNYTIFEAISVHILSSQRVNLVSIPDLCGMPKYFYCASQITKIGAVVCLLMSPGCASVGKQNRRAQLSEGLSCKIFAHLGQVKCEFDSVSLTDCWTIWLAEEPILKILVSP